MAEVVYLDHSQASDLDFIQSLVNQGKSVRTHCCAMVESERSDFYRGTKDECLAEVKRDPPYDAILEISFSRFICLCCIEKIYWLDENGDIESKEIPNDDNDEDDEEEK